MQSLKSIIKKKEENHREVNKYVTKEFQDYGLFLADKLGDKRFLSIYIKLAKETDRALLQRAFSFAIDYPNAKNKGRIFIWKLADLKKQVKGKIQPTQTPSKIDLNPKKTI